MLSGWLTPDRFAEKTSCLTFVIRVRVIWIGILFQILQPAEDSINKMWFCDKFSFKKIFEKFGSGDFLINGFNSLMRIMRINWTNTLRIEEFLSLSLLVMIEIIAKRSSSGESLFHVNWRLFYFIHSVCMVQNLLEKKKIIFEIRMSCHAHCTRPIHVFMKCFWKSMEKTRNSLQMTIFFPKLGNLSTFLLPLSHIWRLLQSNKHEHEQLGQPMIHIKHHRSHTFFWFSRISESVPMNANE